MYRTYPYRYIAPIKVTNPAEWKLDEMIAPATVRFVNWIFRKLYRTKKQKQNVTPGITKACLQARVNKFANNAINIKVLKNPF